MTTGAYARQHTSALRQVTAKGARVTFTAPDAAAYAPATDTFGTPNMSTVSGYAVRIPGDPRLYEHLSLIQSESPSLLFVPDTYGAVPPLDSTMTWSGRTWSVKYLTTVSPDGTSICQEIIITGGAVSLFTGTASLTLGGMAIAAAGSIDDISLLIGALGGNASVPAFYDVRKNITATSIVSAWADALSRAGVPNLTAAGSKRPGWDGVNLLITFDGLDDCLSCAANALFDLSGAYSIILIGAIQSTGATRCRPAAIAESLSAVRLLSVVNDTDGSGGLIDMDQNGGGGTGQVNSLVTVSTTRRCVIVSKSATTGLAIDIPNKARVSGTSTGSVPVGNNALSIGNYFSGGAVASSLVARALICVSHQLSASEVSTVFTWANTNHAAVAA